jgi:hypothetical protein
MTAAPSKDLPVSKHFTGDIRETKKAPEDNWINDYRTASRKQE